MTAKTKREWKLGAATREAFGKAIVELGESNRDIIVLDADLSKSTYTAEFAKRFRHSQRLRPVARRNR